MRARRRGTREMKMGWHRPGLRGACLPALMNGCLLLLAVTGRQHSSCASGVVSLVWINGTSLLCWKRWKEPWKGSVIGSRGPLQPAHLPSIAPSHV